MSVGKPRTSSGVDWEMGAEDQEETGMCIGSFEREQEQWQRWKAVKG